MVKRKRPVSLSEVVRRQFDAFSKARPGTTSVTLTRNAKGNTQIEIVVAAAEDETVAGASGRAQAEYDVLCAKYPITI